MTRLDRATLDAMYDYTIEHEGGSFDPWEFQPRHSGIMVGIVNGTWRRVTSRAEFDKAIRLLVRYIRADKFDSYTTSIGTWVDDDGSIHIDPSTDNDCEDCARALCIKRGQKAYYIIHENREVRL